MKHKNKVINNILETTIEKDVRIKALVNSYIAKGGPITKEQLTDEVIGYLEDDKYVRNFGYWSCYSLDGIYKPSLLNSAWKSWEILSKSLDNRPSFWNKADAEHAKWLDDTQSQTTTITPEQAKMLSRDDVVFMYDIASLGISGIRGDTAIKDNSYVTSPLFFTEQAARARLNEVIAAQAALDKAKAEAEPLEWCEYNEGYRLSPEAFISFDDGKTWTTVTGKFIGVCYSERLGIRARYRNPLWLAKHGKPVESHETPIGETQVKEVVTDVTRCDTASESSRAFNLGYGLGLADTCASDAKPKTAAPTGNKYHRTIHGVSGGSIVVDVYNVLEAFGVTCSACQHAIKKLLCAGLRNKGSRLQDLTEAEASVKRAVELEQQRNEGEK